MGFFILGFNFKVMNLEIEFRDFGDFFCFFNMSFYSRRVVESFFVGRNLRVY